MTDLFNTNISRLPYYLIINNILPYTRNKICTELSADIRSYSNSLDLLIDGCKLDLLFVFTMNNIQYNSESYKNSFDIIGQLLFENDLINYLILNEKIPDVLNRDICPLKISKYVFNSEIIDNEILNILVEDNVSDYLKKQSQLSKRRSRYIWGLLKIDERCEFMKQCRVMRSEYYNLLENLV
tara:strand:- start:184 stop:732 length:549 start_codon:yes stop_codon:yes gene_type:complete